MGRLKAEKRKRIGALTLNIGLCGVSYCDIPTELVLLTLCVLPCVGANRGWINWYMTCLHGVIVVMGFCNVIMM